MRATFAPRLRARTGHLRLHSIFHILLVLAALLATCTAERTTLADDELTDTQVWLADLSEYNVEVGRGELGKNGELGVDGLQITIDGQPRPHSIGAFPVGVAYYELNKQYRTFSGEVAIDDARTGDQIRPVSFRIYTDGVLLWDSRCMYRKGDRQSFLIDVTDTEVIGICTVFTPFENGAQEDDKGYAVWLDPRLDTQPPPELEGVFIPSASVHRDDYKAHELLPMVRQALAEGDYDTLEELADEARGLETQPMAEDDFYQALNQFLLPPISSSLEEQIERLEGWCEAKDDSITPKVALASVWLTYAWQARSSAFTNPEPEAAWKKFNERLDIGYGYLSAAMDIDPTAETWMYGMAIVYATVMEDSPRSAEDLFFAALEINPHDNYPYDVMVTYLLPKWHGTQGDVGRFARRLDEVLPEELRDEAQARLYITYLIQAWTWATELEQEGFEYERLARGFRQIAENYPSQREILDVAARVACDNDDRETAAFLFDRAVQAAWLPWLWGYSTQRDNWVRWSDPTYSDDEMLYALHGLRYQAQHLAISADGQYVAAANGAREGLVTWKLPNERPWTWFFSGESKVLGLQANRNRNVIYAVRETNDPLVLQISSIDLDRRRVGSMRVDRPDANASELHFSPSGRYLAWHNVDGHMRLWDLANPEAVADFHHVQERDSTIHEIAFSPDNQQLAIGSLGGAISIRDSETGQDFTSVLGPGDEALHYVQLCFAADGDHIIAGGRGGRMYLFDAVNRSFVARSEEADLEWGGWIRSVAVSPDGRIAAGGRINGDIVIVDVPSMEIRHTFHGHLGGVDALVFSTNGKLLVSSSRDQRVGVWDLTVLEEEGFAAEEE